MKREPMADPAGERVVVVNVCDPCPAVGFGRYVALDKELERA
jgi:hypothetical protein